MGSRPLWIQGEGPLESGQGGIRVAVLHLGKGSGRVYNAKYIVKFGLFGAESHCPLHRLLGFGELAHSQMGTGQIAVGFALLAALFERLLESRDSDLVITR